MYKEPMLLRRCAVQLAPNLTGSDNQSNDTVFCVKCDENPVNLRALSSNGRLSWTKQLEKAIKSAKENYM